MIEAPSIPACSGVSLRSALAAVEATSCLDSALPVVAGWRDDARFFVTAYLAGLVFFLLILA